MTDEIELVCRRRRRSGNRVGILLHPLYAALFHTQFNRLQYKFDPLILINGALLDPPSAAHVQFDIVCHEII